MEYLNYTVEVALFVIAGIGGYITHQMKKKELRIESIDHRVTSLEKRVDREFAVLDVRMLEIHSDIVDIKKSLRLLLKQRLG